MSQTRIQPEAATPTAAILLVFAAGVMFSCLDSTAKYLVLNGFDAPFVVWMRFATHVVLVLLLLRGWSDWTMYKAVSMPQQLLRGVFLFGSTFFNFLALQTLQLAEALSINFFAPMVVTALAGPLLGEWAGWRRWLAVIVGFVGILVVTRPGFASFGVGIRVDLARTFDGDEILSLLRNTRPTLLCMLPAPLFGLRAARRWPA